MTKNHTTPSPHTARSLDLLVITGSTRDGRFGPTVARWFLGEAQVHPDFAVHAIDLAEIDLPLDLPREPSDQQRRYLQALDEADAVVVVVPEYNHGYPASLKQAIDLARDEWRRKAVGIVSYGARSGGIRATEQLRQVFPELEATTIRESIALPNAWHLFDEHGTPRDAEGLGAAARAMLDQLSWWAAALRTARLADRAPAMSA
jgi:NAD(P)H-dependent FMN reductase